MGPLIFNVYVNDLILSPVNGAMEVYADDSGLTRSNRDPAVIVNKMEEDAIKVTEWLTSNKLLLNLDNTEYMLAAGRGKHRNDEIKGIHIRVGELKTKQSLYTRLLGVTFSRYLTFNLHLHGTQDKEEKGLSKELANRI